MCRCGIAASIGCRRKPQPATGMPFATSTVTHGWHHHRQCDHESLGALRRHARVRRRACGRAALGSVSRQARARCAAPSLRHDSTTDGDGSGSSRRRVRQQVGAIAVACGALSLWRVLGAAAVECWALSLKRATGAIAVSCWVLSLYRAGCYRCRVLSAAAVECWVLSL